MGTTVKELYALCAQQIKSGNGSKSIYISRDDEGNGFHKLFYGFSDPSTGEFFDVEYSGGDTKENSIILG